MAAPKEFHVICNRQSYGNWPAPKEEFTEAEAKTKCASIKEAVTVYGPAQQGIIVTIWAETAKMAASWAKYGLGLEVTGIGTPIKVPLTNAENAEKPGTTVIESSFKQEATF